MTEIWLDQSTGKSNLGLPAGITQISGVPGLDGFAKLILYLGGIGGIKVLILPMPNLEAMIRKVNYTL